MLSIDTEPRTATFRRRRVPAHRNRPAGGQVNPHLNLNFQLDLFGHNVGQEGGADAPTVADPTPTTLRAVPEIGATRPPAGRAYRRTPDPLPRLAEKITAAWYGSHHHGEDIHMPIGIVAALTLIRQTDPDGPDLQAELLNLEGGDLLQVMRDIYGMAWLQFPYRIEIARPIHEWLSEAKAKRQAKAVQATVHAAVRGGLLAYTGEVDPEWRSESDVLGHVLTEFRSPAARKSRGEYHTPAAVANMMAALLQPEALPAGAWFHEPAAGTGGMMRAVALVLRRLDLNPHDYGWSMGELCPVAAACAAVNSITWSLGPNTLIHVGNTLAVGDIVTPAADLRRRVLEHHRREIEQAVREEKWRRAFALVGKLTQPAA